MENPFLYIVPREKEKLINMEDFLDRLKKTVLSILKQGRIVVLQGGYGSGKTLLLQELEKQLPKKISVRHINIGQDIVNDVYSLKEKKKDMVVFIDNADLFVGMGKDYLKKFIETIKSKSIEGITFVLTMNSDTFKTFSKMDRQFGNMVRKLEVPPLSYQDTKKLLISRLNEIREKDKESIEPFDEKELRSIYDKSNGNPRLFLLLCSTIYDKKMNFR